MKKLTNKIAVITSMAILFFAGIFSASAQEVDTYKRGIAGFRFMPTVTSLDLQTSTGGEVSGSTILGFGTGIFVGYNFTNYVGVQAEMIYSSISQKVIELEQEQVINLRYVNIPILLSLNTGKTKVINWNLVVGPQIGFNVGSSLTKTGTPAVDAPDPILSVKKGDFGFAYGAGIDFGLNEARNVRLGLGYRGVFGLLDISDTSGSITTDNYYVLDRSSVKTNSAYIGLSILF
jgi:opacity protein-like surface antigen